MANAKTSYFEKLKDPRWQKKRLEVLEKSAWSCESCGDTKTTFHVHHKQYIKGREPWEYEVGQLSALCSSCHASKHGDDEDALLIAISFLPIDGPHCRDDAASFLAGYANQGMSREYVSDPHAYVCGQFGSILNSWWPKPALEADEIDRLIQLSKVDKAGLVATLRAFISSHETKNA